MNFNRTAMNFNLLTKIRIQELSSIIYTYINKQGRREMLFLMVECQLIRYRRGLPGGALGKNPPDNAGDMGSILGRGRSHMPSN